jgi:biopolymer transport protein ExbD
MKKKRKLPVLVAGSMADVAFLLLIFFLVTTTIESEAGIETTLPPYTEDHTKRPVHYKNILKIEVNGDDKIMLNEIPTQVDQIEASIYDLVFHRAQSPQKAIVTITNSKHTSYNFYIKVYDAIKSGYAAIWEEEAQKKYGRSFETLPKEQQKEITKAYPLQWAEMESPISIVE